MIKTIKNRSCRMCGGKQFFEVLNLGTHSLVNSYIKKADLKKKEMLFPLVIHQCKKCKLVQMLNVIDPEEIYTKGNYLYLSQDVPGLPKYFKEYAGEVSKRFIKKKDDLVLEIASNDGIFLGFLKKNARVLGVDAAPNAVLRALKSGIPTFPALFDKQTAELIHREWGEAKVVLANNCIAHVNNLDDFMAGVDYMLAHDGVFVFETGYWGNMIKDANYGQIYHDHYCYFTVGVWEAYAKKFGMRVFDAVVTPAQSNCALRMFLCRDKRAKTARLKKLELYEKKNKINTFGTSLCYKNDVRAALKNLKSLLIQLKKEGKSVVAYGASAKGGTIARAADIGADLIDYYVDDSKVKQGLYTPIYHVPIVSPDEARENPPDYFLILAVNYADNIIKKEKAFHRAGGKFIVPDDIEPRIV